MSNRKPSEILRAIGERIREPSRWTTDRSARDRTGIAVAADDENAVCYCWLGALTAETVDPRDIELRDPIYRYMRMAVGGYVSDWNDTHTHAEVLAANARAIELAEAAGE